MSDQERKHSRRKILKYSSAFGSAFFINNLMGGAFAQASKLNSKKTFLLNKKMEKLFGGPQVEITDNDFYSKEFNGDEINSNHKILWNVAEYIKSKGGIPMPQESVPVVVVGGGLSGLISAYYLQDKAPIVLESAKQFGGNSKGEFYKSSQYSIGAAYITKPDPGSDLEKLLVDLNLLENFREEKNEESQIFLNQKMVKSFWSGTTDELAKAQFLDIYKDLKDILDNHYPEIPYSSDIENQKLVMEWDNISFSDWIQKKWGTVHPHIMEYFQLYAWSSFGGSIDEISAAQALNFIAAETDVICAFPGGNSAIAQALFEKLSANLKPNSLRTQAMVIDISEQDNGLLVTYVNADGDLQCIRTEKCIVASSKMIAKTIIPQMSEIQKKACDEITYRAYIVANILIEKPFESPCFDLFCLEGEMPDSPSALKPPKRAFTDICFGSWSQADVSEYSVLTIYKPLPYQGARQFLFSELSHQKHKKIIQEAITEFLPFFNTNKDKIKGVRLSRWGHAMPLAAKGLINSGILTQARATINNKIFFANQDNWANPSFETAFYSAYEAIQTMGVRF